MKLFTADQIFLDRRFVPDAAVLVDDEGRIVSAGRLGDVVTLRDVERVHLEGHALLPGCVNSHTHSFQVFLRGNGDNAASFRDWVDAHLYLLVERLDERRLVAAATLAYAEMALSGTTSVGEFFYVHNDASGKRANRHAAAVVEAGRRLGLRVALLRTMYDLGSKPGQARFHETVDEAVANTRELAEAFAADPPRTRCTAPRPR